MITELAASQIGFVAGWQLVGDGVTRAAIRHRVRRRRLISVGRDVYAVGHNDDTRRSRWMIAVLACGPGAVLGFTSAAELWRLMDPAGRTPTVIVRSGRHRPPGVRIHRPRTLDSAHLTRRWRIAVTDTTRTLFDLATVVGHRQLREAVERADRLDLLDVGALLTLCDDAGRGRRGVGRLRRILADFTADDSLSASALEDDFRGLLARSGVPAPAINVPIGPYVVDFAWVRERVIVETDGWSAHKGKPSFDSDRERFGRLQSLGWRVLPVTAKRIRDDSAGLLRDLGALLAIEGLAEHDPREHRRRGGPRS
ncbi:DUF559 domain-containing protein [Thermoleophilia bacterium SCSIO 60948]|nr:DUF559 domain-containing protein [Thermoleophilia bacterium SCSIO 60948]